VSEFENELSSIVGLTSRSKKNPCVKTRQSACLLAAGPSAI